MYTQIYNIYICTCIYIEGSRWRNVPSKWTRTRTNDECMDLAIPQLKLIISAEFHKKWSMQEVLDLWSNMLTYAMLNLSIDWCMTANIIHFACLTMPTSECNTKHVFMYVIYFLTLELYVCFVLNITFWWTSRFIQNAPKKKTVKNTRYQIYSCNHEQHIHQEIYTYITLYVIPETLLLQSNPTHTRFPFILDSHSCWAYDVRNHLGLHF